MYTIKRIALAFTTLLLTIACNQEVKEENAQLKEEKQALEENAQKQDSALKQFVQTFSAVQQNLDSIRSREGNIREASGEGVKNHRELRKQVLEDISAINALMEENQKKLEKLSNNLGERNQRVAKLNRLVANLRTQLEDKDEQIQALKQELASMNFKMEQLNSRVGTLQEETMAQQKTISEQQQSLNTVYYVVGTSKELEENGVMDKKGGFIGLGKTKTLADDPNLEYFTQEDKTKLKRIELNLENDKAKIITEHPEVSYEWEKTDGDIRALKIIDSSKFWKTSKFLAIVVK